MKRILFILSFILFASCSETKELNSTTCNTNNPIEDLSWLKEIRETLYKIDCAGISTITQYTYKANTVFEVNLCGSFADGQTVVYDCNGNIICKFGGISGENTCPDFYDLATNKISLYEN